MTIISTTSIRRYTMSLNDVTPEMLEKGMYKKMPFLKDQIELCRGNQ